MQSFEVAVRRMLRHARKPATLAKLHLVNELCAAIGVTSPTAMLRSLVDAAFAPFPNDRLMHELLVACDLEGRFKQSGFARHAGLSRRRFDATRLEAIRRVAAYARKVLDDSAGAGDDIITTLAAAMLAVNPGAASTVYGIAQRNGSAAGVAALRARAASGELLTAGDTHTLRGADRARGLAIVAQSMALSGADANEIEEVVTHALSALEFSAPNDAQTLFELEWLTFVVSRSKNRAAAMAASAASLRRLAGEQPSLKRRAMLASAWAAVRCGGTSQAREILDDLFRAGARPLDAHEAGLAHLIEAELNFLEDHDASAQQHARSAYRDLAPRAPDGSWAATLLARVDTERETELKLILAVRQRGSWEHTAALAALSRLLLRTGDTAEAARVADEGRAGAHGRYPGLLAHCLVTKGAVEDMRGKTDDAQALYREALLAFVTIHDRICAVDLFDVPCAPPRAFGPLASADPIVEALLHRLRRIPIDPDILSDVICTARGLRERFAAKRYERAVGVIASNRPAFDDAIALGVAPVMPRPERRAFLSALRQLL